MTVEHARTLITKKADRGLESYIDMAESCRELATLCQAMFTVFTEDPEQNADDVEKVLIHNLQQTLNQCADMFVQCDGYYRYLNFKF